MGGHQFMSPKYHYRDENRVTINKTVYEKKIQEDYKKPGKLCDSCKTLVNYTRDCVRDICKKCERFAQ